MLARPSFFADIVHPSARPNIARAMALGVRSACPASRCLMNHAFSANRQASRNSGLPNRSQSARTPRRFSSDTGCPPPELLVTVTMTSGTRSPSASSVRSSAARSTLPLKGWTSDGTRPSGITRSRASAPSTSTLARVVSKWLLLGTTSPERQDRLEEDPLGRAPLVRGDDVAKPGEVLHDGLEAIKRSAAGVRLVALHQRAPLRRRHRAGAGVGEQIDQDVVAAQQEHVAAGLRQRADAVWPRR